MGSTERSSVPEWCGQHTLAACKGESAAIRHIAGLLFDPQMNGLRLRETPESAVLIIADPDLTKTSVAYSDGTQSGGAQHGLR